MSNKDWSTDQQMDEYVFVTKNVIIRFAPRIKLWLYGVTGRSSFMKEFMLKNGIKKNTKPSSALLPKFYVINHKGCDYIANMRDAIIMDKYKDYKKIQRALAFAIGDIASDLAVAEKNLATSKDVLMGYKRKLAIAKRTKNSMNIISYQAAEESQKTLIKASERRIVIMRANLKDLQAQENKNIKQWTKQVSSVESTISHLGKSFEKSITKKVKSIFDFGNFEMHLAEYPATIKQIINGEKY